MGVFYEKKISNWWFILGFLVPPAGLIIYLVMKKDSLIIAKKAGIGALSMVIAIAFILLIVLLYNLNLDPVFRQIAGKFIK